MSRDADAAPAHIQLAQLLDGLPDAAFVARLGENSLLLRHEQLGVYQTVEDPVHAAAERQRIGLARAFLHDAPFMLLDEPTSNLDSLNEAVILRSLHEERNGKTVVLVSHRESTMRIADKIYSVEHGRMS